MLSLGALFLTLPILGDASTVTLNAGAATEATAGTSTNPTTETPEGRASTALTLSSGVERAGSRSRLSLSYAQRYFLDLLLQTGEEYEPLLLHTLVSGYQVGLDKRTSLSMSGSAAAGEVTNNAVNLVFEPGTNTRRVRSLPVFNTDAAAQLEHRATPRYGVRWRIGAGYSSSFLTVPNDPESSREGLPTTYTADTAVTNSYTTSPVDRWSLIARARYIEVLSPPDPAKSTYSAGSTLAWSHTLGPRSGLQLSGGTDVNFLLGQDEISLSPSGELSHQMVWQPGGQSWSSKARVGLRSFLDRVNGALTTQSFVGLSVAGQIGRNVSTGVQLFGATAISAPREDSSYDTSIELSLPTRYRIDDRSGLTFGARFGWQGGHLESDDPPEPLVEALGYVGYGIVFGGQRSNR